MEVWKFCFFGSVNINGNVDHLVSLHLKPDDDIKSELHVLQDICQPTINLPTKTIPQTQQVLLLPIAHVQYPNLKIVLCLMISRPWNKPRIKKESEFKWNTTARIMKTNEKIITIHASWIIGNQIYWMEKMHVVDNPNMNYERILGRDILEQVEIIIDFK